MVREALMRSVGIPIAERIKGWPVSRYLREYEESQWWSLDRIREVQNARLPSLVEHAYRSVPFYRRTMEERGITPSDIRTVNDLQKLPILTKDSVRKNLSEMVSSDYEVSSLVIASSSGSTGEPFRYYISQDEKARKWAALYLFWGWAGFRLGDRHVNFVAGPHRAFAGNKLLMYLESSLSGMKTLSALNLYDSNAQGYLREIERFRPKIIRGYASSIFRLAQLARESGANIRASSVCTTGETLFEFQRLLIGSVFQCQVFDGYGGEGMQVAAQCGSDAGYHVNATSIIVEIVDEQGRPCEAGTTGQVVLTDLHRYSMPFIRYNIQDIAAHSDHACSCGRGLPLLSSLSGRLTDVGITPSGKAVVAHFFTILFMKLSPAVESFQVLQERPDLFQISVVPGPGFDSVRHEIITKTQDYVGPDVQVLLNEVRKIPLTAAGKRRFFISKCGPTAAQTITLDS